MAKLEKLGPNHNHYSHVLDERFNLLDPVHYLEIYGKGYRGRALSYSIGMITEQEYWKNPPEEACHVLSTPIKDALLMGYSGPEHQKGYGHKWPDKDDSNSQIDDSEYEDDVSNV